MRLLFATGMALLVTGLCWGWPADHSPFRPGTEPPGFPLRECVEVVSEKTSPTIPYAYEFARTSNGFPRIRVALEDDWDLSARGTDGSVMLPPMAIPGAPASSLRVFSELLNEDKTPDYVIVTWNSGCGLGAEIFFEIFLLSHPKGYTARKLICYDPGPEDYLAVRKDGRPLFTHTMFVRGEAGKDARSHNYWVHNLLRFQGTSIVSANSALPGFPKWVWYTYGENHQDTTQLTAEQRQRLWQETRKRTAETWGPALFPDSESLTEEQGKRGKPTRGGAGVRR